MKKKPAQNVFRYYYVCRGFTLIEIIVVVTIFIAIGTFSTIFFSRLLNQSNVSAIEDQLVAAFRKAHTYAVTSRKSTSTGWGVHYNPTNRRVTVFQGATYASRNTALDESFTAPNTVTISGFSEVDFQRITGYPTFVGAALPALSPVPTPVITPPGNWYNATWGYRKKITIDGARVSGSTNLLNFPLLVSITDTGLRTRAQSTGNDIVFTASDGITKINHEIERYTSSTGTLVAWINIPTLNATANTELYMYYGNSSAANQENQTSTWNSSYRGVWHLKELPNGLGGEIRDSTNNSNNGMSNGAMTSANQVPGIIGGSLTFNGTGNFIEVPDNPTLDFGAGQDFTVSAWVRTLQAANSTDYPQIVHKVSPDTAPRYGYEIVLHGASFWPNWYGQIYANGTNVASVGTADIANGSWHYLVVKRSGNQLVTFQDGVLSSTSTAASSTDLSNTFPLRFGRTNYVSPREFFFNGTLDEIKVSSSARSNDWIITEYTNQSAPSTFYSIDAESSYIPAAAPTPPPAYIVTINVSGNNGTTKQIYINGHGIINSGLGPTSAPAPTATPVPPTNTGIPPTPTRTPTPAPPTPTPPAWPYRKMITIQDSQVMGTSNLTNFPVLINLSSDADLAARAQDDGDDLKFTGPDGVTKLDHEIERFNGTTGQLVAWVRVPTLNASANTVVYLYYGNTTATNQQNVAGTWNANYRGVWHFRETSGQHLDSTTNNNDSTAVAVTTQGGTIGIIDRADNYDGIDDKVTIADSDSLTPGTQLTFSAWVKLDTVKHNARIFGKYHNSSPWLSYRFVISTNVIECSITNSTTGFYAGAYSPNTVVAGQWYYIVCLRDASNIVRYYQNGSNVNTYTNTMSGTNLNSDAPMYFGSENGVSDFFDGQIDEVRILNTALSSDWITTEYNNQLSPSTFYSTGAQQVL